jgi:glutathione S-transferase
MNRTLDLLQSWAVSGARLGIGTFTEGHAKTPEKPLELYEFEACPYCRKVRDALTTLDLDALIYPCPKGGTRFRPRVRELGGKEQFPFLVDPNTGSQMYESDAIIAYLFETYGKRGAPGVKFSKPANLTSMAASALRPGRGMTHRPSKAPEQPLELYSFEASPYSRVAREALCELELPYLLHNVGKGGQIDWLLPQMRLKLAPQAPMTTENRTRFVARSGRMQVPYLVDPNTGTEMFESADIVAYLDRTYGG